MRATPRPIFEKYVEALIYKATQHSKRLIVAYKSATSRFIDLLHLKFGWRILVGWSFMKTISKADSYNGHYIRL